MLSAENLSEKQSKRHNEESGLAARATPYLLRSSKFDFEIYRLRFELVPVDSVILPRDNKANVIRGAFGTIFKQLCCGSVCQSCRDCPLRAGCAYADIFEPSPPPDSCRLSATRTSRVLSCFGRRQIPRHDMVRANHFHLSCCCLEKRPSIWLTLWLPFAN